MKKIIVFALLLVVCLSLATIPVAATDVPNKIVDNADLLTDIQEKFLEQTAQEMTSNLGIDIVIVITPSLDNKTADIYAKDFFRSHDYGIGESKTGILFLFSSENCEWTIGTYGKAASALSEDAKNDIFAGIKNSLAEGQFYRAFEQYLNAVTAAVEKSEGSASVSESSLTEEKLNEILDERQQKQNEKELKAATISLVILTVATLAFTGFVLYQRSRI